MKERLRRKKIFYVPGMISIIFIPLLCLFYFYKTDAFEVNVGMDLTLGDEKSFLEYKVATSRKYKIFNLDKNEPVNKKSLDEMRFYLRQLIKKKDTINGIVAHFGFQTKYDVFIDVLNALVIEEAPAYALYKDNFYIWGGLNTSKKVAIESLPGGGLIRCGTGEIMRQQAYWEEKNRKEEEKHNFQISFFKENWTLLSIGYLGLVFLNVFTLVKFNKNG